jgi:regulatory protein
MAQAKLRKLEGEALWGYALRALGGRAHSIAELREKLRRRAGQAGEVEDVLGRLKRAGYLNDRQFASTFAASRLSGRGFGAQRVLRDLRLKRVAPKVAEEAVREAYSDTDENELIEEFLKRKYRTVSLKDYLAEPRHMASAYRRLRLAGFGSSATIRVLKRYAQQAEELESLEEEDRGT